MKKQNAKILLLTSLSLMSIVLVEFVSGYASWMNSSRGKSGFFNLASNALQKISAASASQQKIETKISYWPSSPYVPHPKYGWWYKPGSTTVTLNSSNGSEYAFEIGFNKDGSRLNPFNRKNSQNLYSVWVFGDSYLMGYGINDEVVFSSLLSAINPNLSVKNFSGGGFANTHALLQIIELKKQGLQAPDAIIIGFGESYLDTNVASPSRVRAFTLDSMVDRAEKSKYKPEEFTHARAYIDTNEGLKIDNVPLFGPENRDDLIERTYEQKVEITREILKEIYSFCKNWGVKKLYLAYLTGGEGDPVVISAERIGFSIIDLRRNLGSVIDADRVPLDGHPGPLAHNVYARKINKSLF